ncbi:hypothetical protein [uncultured Aquimarina sp.]|uniref:hypothetical protein n=1 Tax=uncultured Aquimarina sp. TaxID=575652 RepID=UPI00262528DA|nr:hypothetical protein [uncultured Aquimarina sp.]
MKKILPILTLILILSCKSEKKEVSEEFKNTEWQLITFLEKKIRLPINYEKTTIEEIFAKMESLENPDGFVELQYNRLNILKNAGAEFEIFVEKDNVMNSISFMLGPYVPLDNSVVSTYVNMVEGQILPQSKEFGLKYKRTESKFLKYKNAEIIKVKYEQINEQNKRFVTQYLITYKLKTFTMVVINKNDTDFQFLLKNFS